MVPPPAQLRRYVPGWIAARLAGEARPERFDAVLLIADVSGFTALGRRLAADPEGAEKLWRIVNGFFGRAIDLLQAHGGDVLRFAGDAPIVLWPRRDGETLADTARRVVACALALQEQLGAYDTGEGVTVRFRVGIGAGEVLAVELGGTGNRVEPLVGGPPFGQVAGALAAAGVGEVVVSAEVAALLPDAAFAPADGACREVVALGARPEPIAAPEPPPAAPAALRPFVPRGVVERLEAGHEGWLGELRAVSTLFVSVEGIAMESRYQVPGSEQSEGGPGGSHPGEAADGGVAALRRLVPALQDAIYRHGGSVNQFLVDDKGTVLLAAWGLPGTTHVDDPVRAVHAARRVLEVLAEHGLRGSAGVTTGRVFCGVKGNERRAEYGLLGAPVNLAARLMQAAAGALLVDRDTERAARSGFAFEPLPALVLKGLDAPVPVFRPVGTLASPARRAVLGRAGELARLEGLLDRLETGHGGVALVEGESGIGKSVLLAEFAARARARGIPVAIGSADAIEQYTPWFALRSLFAGVLGMDPTLEGDRRAEAVSRWFAARPELVPLAPLLGPVLGVSLPDTAVTAPMEGEARAERTRALGLAILVSAEHSVLIVDDLQWLDSASFELLRFAVRELGRTVVVFGSRPDENGARGAVLRMPGLVHVSLGPLPAPELARLACARLGVESLPDAVLTAIAERSEGHPFYAEELVLALRDEGALRVEDGRCVLDDASGLAKARPRTLDGLIGARLDALAPVQLLSLKTASVLGRVFRQDTLCALYPVPDQRDAVPGALASVVALDLTAVERPEPDLTYLFKHVLTQHVAYGQLLFEQRRSLHAAAARWYEEGRAGPTRPHLPLIAHHWQQAQVRDKAVDALEAAAEVAFASFAHRETIAFLTAARTFDEAGEPRAPEVRRGRWARLVGESMSHLGRTADGLRQLGEAVALLGHPLPSGTVAVVFALVWAGLRQVGRRWLGPPTPREGDPTVALATVSTLAEISLLAYYCADVPLTLLAALRALNLAEEWGPSPELARMKAAFAHIANGSQLHGAAERYSLEAVETAEKFSNALTTARAHQYRGALLCAYGRWAEVGAHGDAAMAASRAVGHSRGEDEARNLEGYVAIWVGDYPRALRAADEMAKSARWRDDPQVAFWATVQRAEALWQQGRAQEAVELLEASDLAAQTDATQRLRGHGVLAHALLDLGRLDQARRVVETSLLPQKRPASFIEGRGYTAPALVFLALWAREGDTHRKAARSATAMLNTFAAIYPQGTAIAGCCDARRRLLEGATARGVAGLEAALAVAVAGRHHLDQRLIHDALAAVPDHPAAPTHRAAAARLRAELETAP